MTLLAGLALLAWAWLLLAHGRFWQAGPKLSPLVPLAAPPVAVIIPARQEATHIGTAVRSILGQSYAAPCRLVVVDDASTDGTAAVARQAAAGDGRLAVLPGLPRPPGWAGKLWAVDQGVAATSEPWLLLTDADIVHDPRHLATLMAHAERIGADMVSEMVALRCESAAERALVPAFVYFFQLLYPFRRVNDPASAVAAAAGGTVLIRRAALQRAGGLAAIADQLIDDVALARRIKPQGRIWLGHSLLARSVRAYPGLVDIWRMVARSAYVQLRHSPWLLAGTVVALSWLFLLPVLAALAGHGPARWLGVAAWLAMAASLVPTLRRFALSPWRALALPAMAAFYVAATLGSALDHHRGRGVTWRGRAYAGGRV